MNKIITEYFPLSQELTLNEANYASDGSITVKGVIQRAEKENGNGRVYPLEILKREVEKYQNEIKNKTSYGELDHSDQTVINLKNVSHLITNVEWRGNDLVGEVKILDTPAGNIAKKILEAGLKIGISSRGLGNTRKEGDKVIVEEDFTLICWDLVSNPSTQGAFLYSNLNENKGIILPTFKYNKVNTLITDILTSK